MTQQELYLFAALVTATLAAVAAFAIALLTKE